MKKKTLKQNLTSSKNKNKSKLENEQNNSQKDIQGSNHFKKIIYKKISQIIGQITITIKTTKAGIDNLILNLMVL